MGHIGYIKNNLDVPNHVLAQGLDESIYFIKTCKWAERKKGSFDHGSTPDQCPNCNRFKKEGQEGLCIKCRRAGVTLDERC